MIILGLLFFVGAFVTAFGAYVTIDAGSTAYGYIYSALAITFSLGAIATWLLSRFERRRNG
jgi:hypothetical protein